MSNLGSGNPNVAADAPPKDPKRTVEPSSSVPASLEDKRKWPWFVWFLVAVTVIVLLAIVEGVVGSNPTPTQDSPQEVGPGRDDPARRNPK